MPIAGIPPAHPASASSPSRSPSLSPSSVAASASALTAGALAYRAAVSTAASGKGDDVSPRNGPLPSPLSDGAVAGGPPLSGSTEAAFAPRERASIAPFLTPGLMADLQPTQAHRDCASQGDERAVAALRKVMCIIATKARGCVKAEGNALGTRRSFRTVGRTLSEPIGRRTGGTSVGSVFSSRLRALTPARKACWCRV